jgi:hypothetical protein
MPCIGSAYKFKTAVNYTQVCLVAGPSIGYSKEEKAFDNGSVSDHRTQHVAAQTQLDSGLILNLSSDI